MDPSLYPGHISPVANYIAYLTTLHINIKQSLSLFQGDVASAYSVLPHSHLIESPFSM